MKQTSPPHVVFMLLVHRRPWFIPLICRQLTSEFNCVVDITLDRPSTDVVAAVDAAMATNSEHVRIRVFEAPAPALDTTQYQFMPVRQFQLDKAQELNPNYIAIHDDDHIMDGPGECRMAMGRDYDLIYIKKLFLWDSLHRYNNAMPEHNSVYLFKNRPGDKFPLDRIIHAPADIHDDPTTTKFQLKHPLLDVGYLWKDERERVFQAYAKAGKIDSSTLPLVSPPELRRLHRTQCSYWHKQIKKELKCLCPERTRCLRKYSVD